MAARILLEGHCAHRRMLWFSLLSLGAEEADRSALASMTRFVLVWVSLAAYNFQRERHGRDRTHLDPGMADIIEKAICDYSGYDASLKRLLLVAH